MKDLKSMTQKEIFDYGIKLLEAMTIKEIEAFLKYNNIPY